MGKHHMHGQTTLYGGGEGSNLYRSCSVQLRRRYWKTGGSVSRVLSKVAVASKVTSKETWTIFLFYIRTA